MRSRDGLRLPEAELVEIGAGGIAVQALGLVRHEDDGLAGGGEGDEVKDGEGGLEPLAQTAGVAGALLPGVAAAELDAYRKSLPLDELALFEAGDSPLGRALAALGKAVKKRESDNQTESPSHLYLRGET